MTASRLVPLVLALAAGVVPAAALAAGAGDDPEPEPGSTTVRAAGGVTLLRPPATLPCPNLTGRPFLLTIGARFTTRPSRGGASTVETLVLGQASHGPRYLKPPARGRGWDYGTFRIAACGRSLRLRYQVQLGTRTPRPKRNFTYGFRVLSPESS
jgi:hypothetical protein